MTVSPETVSRETVSPDSGDGWWVGVPAAAQTADAHLLDALDTAVGDTGRHVVWVQTHVDRSGAGARVTVSWQLSPGPRDDGTLVARWATALCGAVRPAGGAPTEGRVVRFPGDDRVPDRVQVRALLAGTAIDRVVGTGSPVDPDDVVDTLDGFLRPTRTPDGVELLVDRAGPDSWRPVEIRSPHQCCAGH